MCQGILEKPFHHGPTKGGEAEALKYHRQYEETLRLYAVEFGVRAPDDIWPQPEVRFRHADQFIRTNRARCWILTKPSPAMTTLLMSPLLIAACTQSEDNSDFWFYVKVAFGVYIVYKVLQWLYRHGGGKGSGGAGCSGCSGCGG